MLVGEKAEAVEPADCPKINSASRWDRKNLRFPEINLRHSLTKEIGCQKITLFSLKVLRYRTDLHRLTSAKVVDYRKSKVNGKKVSTKKMKRFVLAKIPFYLEHVTWYFQFIFTPHEDGVHLQWPKELGRSPKFIVRSSNHSASANICPQFVTVNSWLPLRQEFTFFCRLTRFIRYTLGNVQFWRSVEF